MGDPEWAELLRGARKLDHAVELGATLPRTPCEAEDKAAVICEAEAGADPDLLGAKSRGLPERVGDPPPLWREPRGAARQKSGHCRGQGEPPPSRPCPPFRLPVERIREADERFIDGPRARPEFAEAFSDLDENVRIAAACRELPSFSEERGRLVLDIAQTSKVSHDLTARRRSLSEVLRRLRERVHELPHAPPVPQRLGRIVEPHPLGRAAMPLRRFPSVAPLLPVVSKQRRPLAELPRVRSSIARATAACTRALRSTSWER